MNAKTDRSGRPSRNVFTVASWGILAALAIAGTPTMATAQSSRAVAPPEAAVPTTRILAIGTLTSKANATNLKVTLQSEVRDTVQLYLAGKLDQWFVKQDDTGVVFILNVTDVTQARAMLEGLPLGQAGLMSFQLTPLGPLRPLGVLLGK
ncbi:hypothetical protein [Sphingomonas glacialis]|nr:hypothetical protein [Sphingomonas glacialis]